MALFFCINSIYASGIILGIEIQNIIVNGGTIYIGVYFNEQAFKNGNPNISLQINPVNNIIVQEITLPEGECVVGIHQDSNGDGKMDYGLFGIPKEPYGFSKMRGKIPGNFNQLKISVNNINRRIIIPIIKY
jgi:uncharacterized protein (DUF2141 family)